MSQYPVDILIEDPNADSDEIGEDDEGRIGGAGGGHGAG